jgi:hypothetical protein
MRQRTQIAKSPRSRDTNKNNKSNQQVETPLVPAPIAPPGIGNSSSFPSPWEISSDDDNSGTLHLEPNSAYLHYRRHSTTSSGGNALPAAPSSGSYSSSWRRHYNPLHRHQRHGSSELDNSQHCVGDTKKHDDHAVTLSHHYQSHPTSNRSRLLPMDPLRPVYSSLRTPHMIPDSKYQEFVLGEAFAKRQRPPPVDPICCSKFCAGFSLVAMTFLLFIGILLDAQPIFIKGVLPQHVQYTTSKKMVVFYSITLSERLTPAAHAYQASFVYFLTALLSLGYAYNARWWFQSRVVRRYYTDIPDADSTVPTFHQSNSGDEDGHNLLLAAHRRSGSRMSFGGRATQAYNYYNTNFSSKMMQLVSLAWNRAGVFVETVWPWPKNRHTRRRRTASTKDV